MQLFLDAQHLELLTQKVFLHPVYRHVLLHYARHQQIHSFTLFCQNGIPEEVQKSIRQDPWLQDLTIHFTTADATSRPRPILDVPCGDKIFSVRTPSDLPKLRNEIAEQIRIKALTPVAKHINKRISLPISALIARTPITPNQITIFAMLFSLAGAFCFFSPTTYFLAFACFQINSLLDGTDGEVARMNFRFTDFGKKLDVYCDYITSVLLIVGEFLGLSLFTKNAAVIWGSVLGVSSLLLIAALWIIAIKKNLTPDNFDDIEGHCHRRLHHPQTMLEYFLSVFQFISHRDFYILLVFILSLFELYYVIHFFLVLVSVSWLLLTVFSLKICVELKQAHFPSGI